MRMTNSGRDGADLLAGLADQIWHERADKIEHLFHHMLKGLHEFRRNHSGKPVTQNDMWGVRIWAAKKVDGEV